jgi:hypothetical protein
MVATKSQKRNLVEGESDKHDSRNARDSSCAFA